MAVRFEKRRIVLDTEAAAWEFLDQIVNDRIDAEDIYLDFSTADWLQARFKFNGDDFEQSLFPSTMRGIVEFQNSYYKSIALFTKNDPRIIRLTDAEKDEFEINFKVGEGSTELIASAIEQVGKLGDKYFENMTAKQKFTLAVLIALLFFGGYTVSHYLSHVESVKQSEIEIERLQTLRQAVEGSQRAAADAQETSRQTIAAATDNMRILADAYRKVDGAKAVGDFSIEGFSSVVKQSYRAESIEIKNAPISSEQMKEITRQSRRKPEDVVITRPFKVLAVDGTAERGFTVKLQPPLSELTIQASLSDAISRDRFGKVIQNAFWSKSIINVQVSGRQLGEDIIDAKILAARRIRN